MKHIEYTSLKVGDFVRGISHNDFCRVSKITDKSISFQPLYIPGNNIEYFKSLGLKKVKFTGNIPWDGQLRVPYHGNEDKFTQGQEFTERLTHKFRGTIRANKGTLMDKPSDLIYVKDFYQT